MPGPMLKAAMILALFSTCVFVVVSLPLVSLIGNALGGLNTESFDMTRRFQDGKTTYGLVPEARDCKFFNCHDGEIALQVPDHLKTNYNTASRNHCVCVPAKDAAVFKRLVRVTDSRIARNLVVRQRIEELKNHRRRSHAHEPLTKETNFTYVPPAKTDITPDLLAESLAVQPQDTATVGSVMPYFKDAVISYGVQLNGFVAGTMTLNASTSLPCANIGAGQKVQPDLVLRPKDVDNGTVQAFIPDCTIIAVNMYSPKFINYWVMNEAGSIFSLVSSNKLVNIDQLNSTASTSLVLRAVTGGSVKRDVAASADYEPMNIAKRAFSVPDVHSASMTAEACAAMTCNNNGGKPAVFNPFTKTCLCRDPIYVETEIA